MKRQTCLLMTMALLGSACVVPFPAQLDAGDVGDDVGDATTGTETDGTGGDPIMDPDQGDGDGDGDGDPQPGAGTLEDYGFVQYDLTDIDGVDYVGFASLDDDPSSIDAYAFQATKVISYSGDGPLFTELGYQSIPSNFITRGTTGDFDGDSDVDVAVFDDYGDEFWLLRNDGTGVLEPAETIPIEGFYGFGAIGMAAFDPLIDDLFIPQGHSEGAWLASADGQGGMAVSAMVPAPGCYFSNTAVGDLDGDGLDELVGVGSCNSIPDSTHLGVYGVGGNDSFMTTQLVTAENAMPVEGGEIEVTDMDGDDDLDVIVPANGRLVWFDNLGDGTFAENPKQLAHTHFELADHLQRLDLGPAGVGFVIQHWDFDAGALLVPDAELDHLTTTELSLGSQRFFDAVDVSGDGKLDLAILEFGHLSFWISDG